jgi:UDP-N-acetylmuramoyl-tripeptide--D-alanyl-D-alanine ligase
MVWTGQEIVTATAAAASAAAAAGTVVETVCTDSRRAAPGALFVALRGPHHDAHAFVAEALARGAAAALVEHVPAGVDPQRAFVVGDTLRALGDLAAYTRRRWAGPVAAITGSNGKTTTKEMLASVLGDTALRTHANENNLIGLPLTLLRVTDAHRAAVLEMGMNALGEIARMTEIAMPDVGVITNIGPAHLAGLGSIEGIAHAKGELFAGMRADRCIAVNTDDPWVVRVAARFAGRRVEFGAGGEVAAAEVRDRGFDGVAFTLRIGARSAPVQLRMPGRHNVQNALAAAAAAHALGIRIDAIADGLSRAAPARMRLEVVRLANGVTVVNDAYNANPASTEAALDTIARTPGRTIAVLGEMRELGADSATLHRRVGAHAAAVGIGWLIAVGPEAEHVAAGARATGAALEVTVCDTAAQAAALIIARWRSGDVIVVKGSRGADGEEGVRRYGARMAEVAVRLEAAGGRA